MTIFSEQYSAAAACPDEGTVETGRPVSGPFVAGDFSDQAYDQICLILKEQQGFVLDGYKDLCIKRRIAARIRALELSDQDTYIESLREDQAEQEKLLAALAIHVSQFFRNPSTFTVLERRILPELLRRARHINGKLRIWSAGCACGEEPYSIALLCRQLMREGDQVSIIATDYSTEVLQRAKQARFATNRVTSVPLEIRRHWFRQEAGYFQLDESIRQAVRFFRHDILSDPPFFQADLILCRNLLIYFSREQQQQILQMLAEALLPGGYLVLGRAETLVPACRDFFCCFDPAERIYQRLGDEEKNKSEY